MNILNRYPVLARHLASDVRKKRLGADQYKLLGGWRAFMPSAHIPALLRAMIDKEPYPVNGLLIFGGNPLTTVANPRQVSTALQALQLLVVTDLFMTPTAALADFVLPAAFWPEVEQVIGYPLVAENMVFCQKKAVQHYDCRQDEWIIDQLSQRLGLPGSNANLADINQQRVESLPINMHQLQQQGVYYPEHVYYKYRQKGFRTRTGKIELFCPALERLGYAPLPSYQEPPESPVSTPDLAEEFPYILTTGARRREFFHSEHRQIDSLRQLRPFPQADIHPEQAAIHGVTNNDRVRITSPRGSITMRAFVTTDILPGVINIDHGWWFPEQGSPEFGVWASNANLLTNNLPPYDPAFGTYQLRGLLCKLTKENTPASSINTLQKDD